MLSLCRNVCASVRQRCSAYYECNLVIPPTKPHGDHTMTSQSIFTFKNIELIENSIKLPFLEPGTGQVNGNKIRAKMTTYNCPKQLSPLVQWCTDLDSSSINWAVALSNIFHLISRNFKLIQFQYKLMMRISTCRYMRYKMKIVTDSAMCSLCSNSLETLSHIYLHCPHTSTFVGELESFIRAKVAPNYRDPKKVHLIVCNHDNQTANYLNMVAKWYISKQFQEGKPLIWEGFIRLLKLALTGDKAERRTAINTALAVRGTAQSAIVN